MLATTVLYQATFFSAFLVLTPFFAFADFKGDLVLVRHKSDETKRVLKYDFAYIDPDGLGWEASAGDVTDGASIPIIFQPIIGGPWTYDYLKAAVIHDHYCDREVRPWRDTHKVFFHALVEAGVPKIKALGMYYAVMVGGPTWGELMEPQECSLLGGGICIKSGDTFIASRGDKYNDPIIAADVANFIHALEKSNLDFTPEMIERAAALRHPDDPFLNNKWGQRPGAHTTE